MKGWMSEAKKWPIASMNTIAATSIFVNSSVTGRTIASSVIPYGYGDRLQRHWKSEDVGPVLDNLISKPKYMVIEPYLGERMSFDWIGHWKKQGYVPSEMWVLYKEEDRKEIEVYEHVSIRKYSRVRHSLTTPTMLYRGEVPVPNGWKIDRGSHLGKGYTFTSYEQEKKIEWVAQYHLFDQPVSEKDFLEVFNATGNEKDALLGYWYLKYQQRQKERGDKDYFENA
ncbi:MAG: hypothetical protein JWO15_3578 [Sphingomonadales bacterium]|nr:hypothetical protein [Sphingomonadales bacterium]